MQIYKKIYINIKEIYYNDDIGISNNTVTNNHDN